MDINTHISLYKSIRSAGSISWLLKRVILFMKNWDLRIKFISTRI